MIKGICRSNVDEFRTGNWPELFVEVPKVGDYVANSNGLTMKVTSVTHKVRNKIEAKERMQIELEPYVEIELWKQPPLKP